MNNLTSQDDEFEPSSSKTRTTRPKNKRAKTVIEKSSDDDNSDWLDEDSDYKRPLKRLCKTR